MRGLGVDTIFHKSSLAHGLARRGDRSLGEKRAQVPARLRHFRVEVLLEIRQNLRQTSFEPSRNVGAFSHRQSFIACTAAKQEPPIGRKRAFFATRRALSASMREWAHDSTRNVVFRTRGPRGDGGEAKRLLSRRDERRDLVSTLSRRKTIVSARPSMTEYAVEVQPDFLERLAKAQPIAAVAELIWNELDADATAITVNLETDPLGALRRIIVTDDGHGFPFSDAPANCRWRSFVRLGAAPDEPERAETRAV
jgi:hypothetical protein